MSFWAEKLNGITNTTPTPLPVSRELYGIYTNPVAQPQTVSTQQEYIPTVRMTQGSTCPGCGSDKYLGRIGERAVSCAECGYHPRFEQTGYGTPSLRAESGAVTPARQYHGGQTMQKSIAILNLGGGEHI
jgi:ribosomal protein L37AE/L43A